MPNSKLDSFENLVHKLPFEYNFQFGKISRAEPQLKKHVKSLIFTKKCYNFADFPKEISQSWYFETSFIKKHWVFSKILQIFSILIFQDLIYQKYLLFEQNPCRLALIMTFRVCLSKKLKFSFWRVLVTVQGFPHPRRIGTVNSWIIEILNNL